MSFTDPNLRRILDISKVERANEEELHHYCIKKKYNKLDAESRLKRFLINNNRVLDKKVKDLLSSNKITKYLIALMERFEEEDAASFGIGVIWVESYDDIPDILRKIRNIE